MKIIISLFFFVCSFAVYAQQETNQLTEADIIGRWESKVYNLEKQEAKDNESLHIYYFKDNNVFHRGEIVDGAIIFNITGKYSVKGDSIKMVYQNYLKHNTETRKPQTMILEVFYKSPNRMDADIIEPKNQSPLILVREGFSE